MKNLPKADKDIVMLSVWLHDLQRIRKIDGHHAKIGASEAESVMKKYGIGAGITQSVEKVILCHSCNNSILPRTLEEKIISSADAMAHYINDFYFKIAISGERNIDDYKKWALKKIEKDYKKKIKFGFAKKIIKSRHDALKKVLTME